MHWHPPRVSKYEDEATAWIFLWTRREASNGFLELHTIVISEDYTVTQLKLTRNRRIILRILW